MSDTPDPFAARPYQPPSERNAESTSETVSEAAVEPPVDLVSEAPVEAAEPPAVSAADDTAVEVNDPEPVVPAAPTPPVQEPAAAPEPATGTTHRFEAPNAAEPSAPEPAATDWSTASSYAREPEPAAPAPAPAATIPESAVFGSAGEASAAPSHSQSSYTPSSYLPPVQSEFDRPKKKRGVGRKLAGALTVALIGGAAGVGGAAAYDEYLAPKSTSISALDQDTDTAKAPTGQVEKVAASVMPSVVQIMVSGDDAAGSGTGIIISDDGEILTNNHVVDVAAGDDGKIVIVFSDGTNTSAKIVGQDPVTDLAVIKAAKVKGLSPATLGSNRTLQVGQTVVAVGSPFGLSSTVTAGIISALNRPVTEPGDDEDGSSGTTFPGIQTDAAINPGNSGGPLLDLNGRVIGINSVIQSSGGGLFGGEAGSIGLGFAIPIDLAKSVAKQLLDGKKVEHAQIGVTVSAAVADNKLTTIGALVRDVNKGSAGDKAGLKSGDIITAVDNIPVARSEGLIAAIRAYEPGEKVTLTYLRDDKKRTTEVTLGSDGGKASK